MKERDGSNNRMPATAGTQSTAGSQATAGMKATTGPTTQ
jgi:hypothetical protein